MLSCGGSFVPTDTIRRFREVAPSDCVYFTSYGMTETCGKISMTMLPHWNISSKQIETIFQTSGRSFASLEVRVVCVKGDEAGLDYSDEKSDALYEVDPQYIEVKTDGTQVGQVQVRGATLFDRYWNQNYATETAFTNDGWFITGDLATVHTIRSQNNNRDRCQYIKVVDRRKDLIVVGGENVYTSEVENVLHDLVYVKEVCIYGVPDDVLGQVVKAVVVLDEDKLLNAVSQEVLIHELEKYCKKNLATFKCPVFWKLQSYPLPRTGSGKVKRYELRLRDTPECHLIENEPMSHVLCHDMYNTIWKASGLPGEGQKSMIHAKSVETFFANSHLFAITDQSSYYNEIAEAIMTKWKGATCCHLTHVPNSECLRPHSCVTSDKGEGNRHIVFIPRKEYFHEYDEAQRLTRRVAAIVKHADMVDIPWCLWIVTMTVGGACHGCLSSLARVVNAEYSREKPGRCCVNIQLSVDQNIGGEAVFSGNLGDILLNEMRNKSMETDIRMHLISTEDNSQNFVLKQRYVRRLVPKPRLLSNSTLPFQCKGGCMYIVTGAFGGIGLNLCRWLIRSCGCRHLLMTVSSLPLSKDRCAALDELRGITPGITVRVTKMNTNNPLEVSNIFVNALQYHTREEDAVMEVGGVFHLAGVHRDDLLKDMDEEKVSAVMGAKVVGAVSLLEAMSKYTDETNDSISTKDAFLCLFSSIFSVLGFAKLAHYATANGFLDCMKSSKVRTISINWGTFEGAGMAHRLGPLWAEHWKGMGMRFVNVRKAFTTLSHILLESESRKASRADRSIRVGIFGDEIDWEAFVDSKYIDKKQSHNVPPILREIVKRNNNIQPPTVAPKTPPCNANTKSVAYVNDVIIEAVKMLVPSIGIDSLRQQKDLSFTSLGIDSLTAPRLRVILQKQLQIKIPATVLFRHRTIESLAECVSDLVNASKQASIPKGSAASSSSGKKTSTSRKKYHGQRDLNSSTIKSAIVAALQSLDLPCADYSWESLHNKSFPSIGVDSLMTPRLRARLQKLLDVKVPATLFFRHTHIDTLAKALEQLHYESSLLGVLV